MALGALTSVDQKILPTGPTFVDLCTLVGDGAYPTTGSTGLLAALRALRKDQRKIFAVHLYKSTTLGQTVRYDPATDKLMAVTYAAAPPVEVTNATDLSGTTYSLEIWSQ